VPSLYRAAGQQGHEVLEEGGGQGRLLQLQRQTCRGGQAGTNKEESLDQNKAAQGSAKAG